MHAIAFARPNRAAGRDEALALEWLGRGHDGNVSPPPPTEKSVLSSAPIENEAPKEPEPAEPETPPPPVIEATPKPSPKAEPKPAPRPEPKPAPKAVARAKPEPRADPKPKPETRPEPKAKPAPKPPAPKPEPAAKGGGKTGLRAECKKPVDLLIRGVGEFKGVTRKIIPLPAGVVQVGVVKDGQRKNYTMRIVEGEFVDLICD